MAGSSHCIAAIGLFILSAFLPGRLIRHFHQILQQRRHAGKFLFCLSRGRARPSAKNLHGWKTISVFVRSQSSRLNGHVL
jgi:hypothetical protein